MLYVMNRLFKQFIYAITQLTLFSLIAYGVYSWFAPNPTCFDNKQNQGEEEIDCGGPNCPTCEIRHLKPIESLPVQFLDAGGQGRSTILVELRNPNEGWGAQQFNYVINFYNSSSTPVASLSGVSFIYSGEIKYLILPGVVLDSSLVTRSETLISSPNWLQRDVFPQPKISFRQVKGVIDKKNKQIVVSGNLVNEDSSSFATVNVSAVVSNQVGQPVGASKTLLKDIKAFEERFFQINIPVVDTAIVNLDSIKTLVETKK